LAAPLFFVRKESIPLGSTHSMRTFFVLHAIIDVAASAVRNDTRIADRATTFHVVPWPQLSQAHRSLAVNQLFSVLTQINTRGSFEANNINKV
jgi:hypothetical protein